MYLYLCICGANKGECLPIRRSLLWVDTLVDGVIENEAVSAAKLDRVHPKLTVDVFPEKEKVKYLCLINN